MTDGDPEGYDYLADRAEELDGWATPWSENPLQRLYSWPATRELLPPVDGKRVLDAGCGIGDHAAWLLDEGATVTGVDASERAVATARERVGERATIRRADLREPLGFEDGAFDGVLSHLVLDHVAELGPVFDEFARVLADDGWLVFTVIHPMQYYLAYDVDRYYDRQPVEVTWEAPVTSYHRPVSGIVGALTAAGFAPDALREPEPPERYVAVAADEWEPDERPQILCVRARIPG